jgi:hypothetical protein
MAHAVSCACIAHGLVGALPSPPPPFPPPTSQQALADDSLKSQIKRAAIRRVLQRLSGELLTDEVPVSLPDTRRTCSVPAAGAALAFEQPGSVPRDWSLDCPSSLSPPPRLSALHRAPPPPPRRAAQHLKAIATAFQSHLSPPRDGTDRINYDDFSIVAQEIKDSVTPLAAVFFTATNFLKVRPSSHLGTARCVQRFTRLDLGAGCGFLFHVPSVCV